MNLPYRHDLLIRVTVADDGPTGEHGYIDVAARLTTLIAGLDPHVVDVASLPAGVVYLGRTDDEAGDPSDEMTIAEFIGHLDRISGVVDDLGGRQ